MDYENILGLKNQIKFEIEDKSYEINQEMEFDNKFKIQDIDFIETQDDAHFLNISYLKFNPKIDEEMIKEFENENHNHIHLFNNTSINRNKDGNGDNQIIQKEKITTTPIPSEYSNKQKFKLKIREMKLNTETYLDYVKANFVSYIENQKNHLSNCLTTIDDIIDIEQTTLQGEETKNKTIDKKLEEFTRELSILVNELNKITK